MINESGKGNIMFPIGFKYIIEGALSILYICDSSRPSPQSPGVRMVRILSSGLPVVVHSYLWYQGMQASNK